MRGVSNKHCLLTFFILSYTMALGGANISSLEHYVKDNKKMTHFLSFSIYCLALTFEHYRQVYIVLSGLQDESLQVTISKLP